MRESFYLRRITLSIGLDIIVAVVVRRDLVVRSVINHGVPCPSDNVIVVGEGVEKKISFGRWKHFKVVVDDHMIGNVNVGGARRSRVAAKAKVIAGRALDHIVDDDTVKRLRSRQSRLDFDASSAVDHRDDIVLDDRIHECAVRSKDMDIDNLQPSRETLQHVVDRRDMIVRDPGDVVLAKPAADRRPASEKLWGWREDRQFIVQDMEGLIIDILNGLFSGCSITVVITEMMRG